MENIRIIAKDTLPVGGFAGIVETRMVMSPNIWRGVAIRDDISHGLGDFIYLANGYFQPNDGAPIHPHQDVDIVSIILNGEVGHKGTLGDGTTIKGGGIQVQRAGTGMQHAEFSLTDEAAGIIQVWFLPPEKGLEPAYQNFDLPAGEITTVLGGENTFNSTMRCRVGELTAGKSLSFADDAIVLLTNGEATIHNEMAESTAVKKDDLIEGNQFTLTTDSGCHLVIIERNQ